MKKTTEVTPMDRVRLARKACKQGKQVYLRWWIGSHLIKVQEIIISFKSRVVLVKKISWWARYTFEEINSGQCSFEIES